MKKQLLFITFALFTQVALGMEQPSTPQTPEKVKRERAASALALLADTNKGRITQGDPKPELVSRRTRVFKRGEPTRRDFKAPVRESQLTAKVSSYVEPYTAAQHAKLIAEVEAYLDECDKLKSKYPRTATSSTKTNSPKPENTTVMQESSSSENN